jgi:hypothetical protein
MQIGVVLGMIICGEIQQIQMKQDNDLVMTDIIFQQDMNGQDSCILIYIKNEKNLILVRIFIQMLHLNLL